MIHNSHYTHLWFFVKIVPVKKNGGETDEYVNIKARYLDTREFVVFNNYFRSQNSLGCAHGFP